MTASMRFSCDGHRHGQPCRGALPTRTTDIVDAYRSASRAGWHFLYGGRTSGSVLLCHSSGHDEEIEAA